MWGLSPEGLWGTGPPTVAPHPQALLSQQLGLHEDRESGWAPAGRGLWTLPTALLSDRELGKIFPLLVESLPWGTGQAICDG